MRHVVMFSGGMGSYFAAKRVAATHKAKNCTLLFCDTRAEDEDLYRFLDEAQAFLGVPLVRIADGRTPWQVFRDVRFLGNSRVDPCSRVLKRDVGQEWLKANCRPQTTRVYVGIDWTEEHRFRRLQARQDDWVWCAPLCEPPYLTPTQMRQELRHDGIEPPRLYGLGFGHNNCAGACVKAGKAHWAHLWRTLPERFLQQEKEEQDLRQQLGADVAILTDRTNGKRRPYPLQELRKQLEKNPELPGGERYDWGGCGCFSGGAPS